MLHNFSGMDQPWLAQVRNPRLQAMSLLNSPDLKLWHRPGHFTTDPYWIDSVGVSGNAFLNNGAAIATDLKGRQGILCDGVDDYTVTGLNTGVSGNANFSFALWLEVRSSADGGYCGIGDTTSSLAAAGIYKLSGNLTMQYAGGNAATAPFSLSNNVYYFLCVVKQAGAIAANTLWYLDGVFQGASTGSSSTPNISNSAFYLGSWANNAAYGNIMWSQAMLYNRALSPGDVANLHQLFR